MYLDIQKHRFSAILFLCWFASYLERFLINMALPFIGKEFQMDEAGLGLLLSTFFAAYALVQLPGGWLSDRIGSRKVIIASIGLFTILSACTGLAWSLASLFVIRFLFGIFEGCFPTASFKAVAEAYPKDERARVQSVLLATNPLSLVVAPLIAAPLITMYGWRGMFMIASLVGLAAFLAFLFGGRPRAAAEVASGGNSGTKWRELLSDVTIWKISAINFGVNILIWGFLSWIPTYMLKVLKLDLMSVGMLASLPGVAGIVGILAGGWLADKMFNGREKHLLVLSISLAAAGLVLMLNTESLLLIVCCQIVVAFAVKLAFIALWALPLKLIDAKNMGAASGIVNLGSQLAGSVSPALVGFMIVLGNGSYSGAFLFLAGCAVVSALVALTIPGSRQPAAAILPGMAATEGTK